jgi:hypothetical protein
MWTGWMKPISIPRLAVVFIYRRTVAGTTFAHRLTDAVCNDSLE